MAESHTPSPDPPTQTADSESALPDGAGRPLPAAERGFAGGSESHCRLWEGHIVDATFPLV